MLKIMCSNCAKYLKRPGAIILSPPDKKDMVEKLHLCVECYKRIMEWLFT